MNQIRHDAPAQSGLMERILNAIPANTYAVTALLSLVDIVESDEVKTAAVTCGAQPRMLVNPQFLERHAATPERLVMLVMHELLHVVLGHTRQFPRVTPLQNFVFDAVINGMLCRMFRTREHAALFTDLYDEAKFPECLLRPPPGWPESMTTATAILNLPPQQRELAEIVHRELYCEAGTTYDDVARLLAGADAERLVGKVPLLGDHEESDEGPEGSSSGPAQETLLDIAQHVLQPCLENEAVLRGVSILDLLDQQRSVPPQPPTAYSELRQLMRRIASKGMSAKQKHLHESPREFTTPVPVLCRRTAVQRSLGFTPLLHQGRTTIQRRRPAEELVHVYLDVSQSMDALIPQLYAAMLDCRELVHPQVHLFSTKVFDVSFAQLKQGECQTTGGTDIECVARHVKDNAVRRAVMITDGLVGHAGIDLQPVLKRLKLGVAYAGNPISARFLKWLKPDAVTLPQDAAVRGLGPFGTLLPRRPGLPCD